MELRKERIQMSDEVNNNSEETLYTGNENNDLEASASHADDLNDTILIGDYLRLLRERSGINIQILSQRTRINLTMLKSLEENDLSSLPNKTYVKGFVKSYIREIQGDINEALEILDETFQKLQPEETQEQIIVEESPEPTNGIELSALLESVNPKHLKLAGALIIGVSFIVFTAKQFSKTSEEMAKATEEIKQEQSVNTPVTTTKNESNENNVAEQSNKDEANKASIAAEKERLRLAEIEKEKIAEQQKKEEALKLKKEQERLAKIAEEKAKPPIVDAKDQKNEEVSPSKENTFPIELAKEYKFSPMRMPLYTALQDAPENNDETILPPNIKAAVVKGKQNIYINSTEGDTWLTYKNGDGPIKSFVLKNGRTLLIRGTQVRLFLGNVHATKIFLNNQLLKIESKNGVKSLVFPQENGSNFVTPLFIRDKNGQRYTSKEYLDFLKENPGTEEKEESEQDSEGNA